MQVLATCINITFDAKYTFECNTDDIKSITICIGDERDVYECSPKEIDSFGFDEAILSDHKDIADYFANQLNKVGIKAYASSTGSVLVLGTDVVGDQNFDKMLGLL